MQHKNILIAVTGGIAVYKACTLVSQLTQQGANVKVIMTKHATNFVSPLTFQALSRNPVYIDTFDEKDPEKIAHIDLADWAEIIIIAPATANIIGKLANGIADDMLSTTLLATEASVYIAPAMNVHMYKHPAVEKNIEQLKQWGYRFIEPQAGYLACGYVGKGRLEDPENIIQVICKDLNRENIFKDKKFLISAGPTREQIDPVRFFTNRSSGKMGYRLAEEAAAQGADVILVSGPVHETVSHQHIKVIDVMSAEEMYQAMIAHFDEAHVVIKAAAVADYRPVNTYQDKVKKQAGHWSIEMERTRDILKALGDRKGKQFVVGFAAETSDLLVNGTKKLRNKNLDAIIMNDISEAGAGFGVDTNIVTYLNKQHQCEKLPLASKRVIAKQILHFIHRDLEGEQ